MTPGANGSDLRPSKAKVWKNCAAAPARYKHIKDISGPFAQEGTNAHYLSQVCLEKGQRPFAYVGQKLRTTACDDTPSVEFIVTGDMARAVSQYTNAVREVYNKTLGGQLYVEHRLEMSYIDPGMKGHADCVIGVPFDIVYVFDYKNGRVPVEDPRTNPQLACYGSSAAQMFCATRVVLIIVQPHASDGITYQEAELTRQEIDFAAYRLTEAAIRTHAVDAPLTAGPHCKEGYCIARATCPAYQEIGALDLSRPLPTAEAVCADDQRLCAILAVADHATDLIKEVKAHAIQRELGGNPLPGFKPVEGRTKRRWKPDKQADAIVRAAARLGEHITPEDCRQDPKPLSVAQMEGMLKANGIDKKTIDSMLKRWCEKPRGKMHIVTETDKRQRMEWRGADATTLFADYLEERPD